MRRHRTFKSRLAVATLCSFALLLPDGLRAHCDGMDGPVVKAAEKALETGDVNLVLIWVPSQDEPAIRTLFEKTLAVRKLGSAAKELADLYFFETLVRIHRAGEGAPYTGLKPAGRDLGPAIPAADRAVETGSIEPLLKLLTDEVVRRVRTGFDELIAKKGFRPSDTNAGREYVRAYVTFIHDVERIHQSAVSPGEGHVEAAQEGQDSEHIH